MNGQIVGGLTVYCENVFTVGDIEWSDSRQVVCIDSFTKDNNEWSNSRRVDY